MLTRTLRLPVFIMLMILLMTSSVLAQRGFSDDQLDLIDLSKAAFDNVYTLESVRVTGWQTITLELEVQNETLEMTLSQDFDGWTLLEDGITSAVEITIYQEIALDAGSQGQASGDQTLEMILIDGELYVRVADSGGALRGVGPDDWVNLSQDPDAFPEMGEQDIDSIIEQSINPIPYPITASTVRQIEEADPEKLNGENVRVIDIVLDTSTLAGTAMFDEMRDAFESLGIRDTDEVLEVLLEDAVLEIRLWVGEDGIMRQSSQAFEFDGDISEFFPRGVGDVLIAMSVSSVTTYTDLNKPHEIEAPDVD